MHNGLNKLVDGFKRELKESEGHQKADIIGLDPTQRLVVDVIAEWAEQHAKWKNAVGQALPPRLQVLLLGTAGTGKTHTAKIAITEVRLRLGSFESVLAMAFSGVASANLGAGSRTIDSIFHTNRPEAAHDLVGPELDILVDELGCVDFIVIDEISTCGAGTFEVVSRRMQQVARVKWRRLCHAPPPEDLGPFRWYWRPAHGGLCPAPAGPQHQLDGKDAYHRWRGHEHFLGSGWQANLQLI